MHVWMQDITNWRIEEYNFNIIRKAQTISLVHELNFVFWEFNTEELFTISAELWNFFSQKDGNKKHRHSVLQHSVYF